MAIDWITVAAQVVNFLVLIWLLRRFLYRPILSGIDAREREIADRMSEAAHIREAAEAMEADFNARIENLRASREGLLEEAGQAARKERDALLAEARSRLTQEQAARDTQRAEEARRFSNDLCHTGAAALLALTRKALADLSGETLEGRIVARASERLAAMSADLKKAAGKSSEAIITTRDALQQDLREQLTAELNSAMPGVALRFRDDPTQSPGVTVRLGGAQLGWTVDSYMDGLEALLKDGAAAQWRRRADAA